MMKLKSFTIWTMSLLLGFLIHSSFAVAQCETDEVEVTIVISTDDYGYEAYWQLFPASSTCGTNTIATGGNLTIGCEGGGLEIQEPSGYGDNITVTEGPFCLTAGDSFSIFYVDDWGDGGFGFDVLVNGYQTASFYEPTGTDFTFTFDALEPLDYDMMLHHSHRPYTFDEQGMKDIKGHIINKGKETITTCEIAYQVDDAPIQTHTFTGLNIPNQGEYHFSHPNESYIAAGSHQLKIWINSLNGTADLNNANDTLTKNLVFSAGIPNIVDDYLTATPTISIIGTAADNLNGPTDLDFHPDLSRKELWTINKRTEANGGSMVIYFDAGQPTQTDETHIDGNAYHFMSLPTGMAFSLNGNWANAPGVFDANHNGDEPFTGPSLWSGDLSIFAQPSGGNGSHLDMLHVNPECQGIASENDNVFWVFDGYNNDIVRCDFQADHGPGNHYHGDAIIRRYSEEAVQKDVNEKVVSHLVLDEKKEWVYVVDYGNQRVIRIDTKSGTPDGTPTFGPYETYAEYSSVTGYTWETVVGNGLVEPAGIDIIEDRMLVSDYATGQIIVYDIASMPATELGRISTDAQGIMGIKIGPDGNIWYVDYDANTVNVVKLNTVVAQINIVLEGAYNHDMMLMNSDLYNNNKLPTKQPYDTFPWDLQNSATNSNLPNTVVDWVIVEARDANDINIVLEQQAALLLNDGTIVDNNNRYNGVAFYTLNENQDYYIAVRHRNHLDVVSANAISLPNANTYDFSSSLTQAMGPNSMAEIGNNKYAMFAGDTDGNGIVSVADFNIYTAQVGAVAVYENADIDLDQHVTVSDFNAYFQNASVIGIEAIRY